MVSCRLRPTSTRGRRAAQTAPRTNRFARPQACGVTTGLPRVGMSAPSDQTDERGGPPERICQHTLHAFLPPPQRSSVPNICSEARRWGSRSQGEERESRPHTICTTQNGARLLPTPSWSGVGIEAEGRARRAVDTIADTRDDEARAETDGGGDRARRAGKMSSSRRPFSSTVRVVLLTSITMCIIRCRRVGIAATAGDVGEPLTRVTRQAGRGAEAGRTSALLMPNGIDAKSGMALMPAGPKEARHQRRRREFPAKQSSLRT